MELHETGLRVPGKISRQKLESLGFLQSYNLVRAIETFLWSFLLSFLAILAFELSFNYWECYKKTCFNLGKKIREKLKIMSILFKKPERDLLKLILSCKLLWFPRNWLFQGIIGLLKVPRQLLCCHWRGCSSVFKAVLLLWRALLSVETRALPGPTPAPALRVSARFVWLPFHRALPLFYLLLSFS